MCIIDVRAFFKFWNIYSYGTNSLANTWDYNKIYTCLCDRTTYHGPLVGAIGITEGYDCSINRCPNGDDPYTVNQVFEIQAIKCTGTGGTLTLTFRSEGKYSKRRSSSCNCR